MTEIKRIDNGNVGEFVIYYDSEKAGLMVYNWINDDTFVISHTEVDEAYNGKGLGKLLVLESVEFARKNGKKIVPMCPFAKVVFERNPDLQDVLA